MRHAATLFVALLLASGCTRAGFNAWNQSDASGFLEDASELTFKDIASQTRDGALTASVDASLDTTIDTAVEPPVDTAVEPPVDTAIEPPVDTAVEPPVDTTVDTAVDAPVDTAADTVVDAPIDTAIDSTVDATHSWPPTVTSANDTCSNPAVLDMASVPMGERINVEVNTQQATSDYPGSCCQHPDVVLRIDNAQGTLFIGNGAGETRLHFNEEGMPCGTFVECRTLGSYSTVGLVVPTPVAYLALCRDPGLGPTIMEYYWY